MDLIYRRSRVGIPEPSMLMQFLSLLLSSISLSQQMNVGRLSVRIIISGIIIGRLRRDGIVGILWWSGDVWMLGMGCVGLLVEKRSVKYVVSVSANWLGVVE
jgi:hypothetical protein